MPRQKRKESKSGIYHIMMRGINQQQIFEDEEDNDKFIEIIKDCKEKSEFKLFAFCLMGNHLHLLIKEEKEPLEVIFKRIGSRYAYWYNWKYKRRGHLFQDRFKSEPVEDDKYLISVLRYIHNNPIKAGLSKKDEYPYSSYNIYIGIQNNQIVDVDYVYEIINKEQFIKYHNEENDDKCLENEEKDFRLTDDEALIIIAKISNCKNVTDFQKLDINERNRKISKIKERGLSIRQISRLTGISKGVVEKC